VGAEDHREFMRAAAAAAVPTLGDWCSIHYIADTGSDLEVEVAHSDPDRVAWAEEIARSFPYRTDAEMGVAAVIRNGQTELVEQISDDVIEMAVAGSDIDPAAARELVDSLGLSSAITVPLLTTRGVRGAMQFVSAESGRTFDGADVALAEVAVRHIAEALDNIWLTQRDRQISATLQRSLLPPRIPSVPGIDVAAAYWPAGVSVEAGGDFYDVFATSPTSWSVLIGDVCGTGPDAAAVTSIARHTVRAAARHGQDHRNTLEWLNEAMHLSDRDRFCTAVYATVEASEHQWRMTSCAAGHPRPVHSTADGQARLVGEHGSLLGVLDTLDLHPSETTLAIGDVVVLYTDGFTDLPPPHDRTEADMVELVAKLAATSDSADEIANGMYRSMAERLPPAQAADDMALVVLRITDLP